MASVHVTTTAELADALAKASGGDTILLAPGTYGRLVVRDLDFDEPVTITSADPSDRAVFDAPVQFRGVAGVTVTDIDFEAGAVAEGFNAPLLSVLDSREVTLRDLSVVGHIPGPGEGVAPAEVSEETGIRMPIEGAAFGMGVMVRNAEDVTLERLDVTQFRTGVILNNVEDSVLRDSHIHHIRADGVTITDARNVAIEDNLFESFDPVSVTNIKGIGDHADFIQFWATGARFGVDGLKISGNALMQGTGGVTQGIFGRFNLRGTEPDSVAFKNIEISNNLINTSHIHGISVSDATDMVIRDNTLLPAPAHPIIPLNTPGQPRIAVGSDARLQDDGSFKLENGDLPRNVTIERNVVVGREDAAIGTREIGQELYRELGIRIGKNTELSSDPAASDHWAKTYGWLQDAGIRDVAAVQSASSGGITGLADWLVSAIAALPEHAPGTVLGTADDDTLTSAAEGAVLIGGAGDDRLQGGAGGQSFADGLGSDWMAGGAGGDTFSLTGPGGSGVPIDTVADLDFAEGDVLILKEGFAARFFSDRTDPGNHLALYNTNRSAVLDSLDDLREVVMHPGVSAVALGSSGTEIRFDADRNGRLDYILRLPGITGIGEDRAAIDGPTRIAGGDGADRIADVAGSSLLAGGGGGDLFVFDRALARPGERDVIEDFDLAAGDRLAFAGFHPAVFSGADLAIDASGQVRIAGPGDLAALDGLAAFDVVAEGADLMIRVDLTGDGATDWRIVALGEAALAPSARTAAPLVIEGAKGADAIHLSAAIAPGGAQLRDLQFGKGDTLTLGGFASGYFQGVTGQGLTLGDGGAALTISSVEGLLALDAVPGLDLRAAGSDRLTLGIDRDRDGIEDWSVRLEGGAGGAALEHLAGRRGRVTEGGTNRDDKVTGGGRTDVMTGGQGDDLLNGRGGDDWLEGGDGADRLTGGTGSDVLIGGAGTDRFLFSASDFASGSVDVIADLDFTEGDRLVLSRFGEAAPVAGSDLHATAGGGIHVRSVQGLVELGLIDGVRVLRVDDGAYRVLIDDPAGAGEAATLHILLDPGSLGPPPADLLIG